VRHSGFGRLHLWYKSRFGGANETYLMVLDLIGRLHTGGSEKVDSTNQREAVEEPMSGSPLTRKDLVSKT